ncbi:hypothetical protein AB1399_08795 [Hydrogenibacillus schlegelii]|uniref:Thiamine biosynthesis protein ThiS n=1 Tax=Hydrogenibacillus schlegelii TaxID=1484 RepID=A0A2T5GDG6_HYDSH|nr:MULTISPECIES: hypothetical protein [Hydrogenibacillus]MBT9281203.1 hypothetical protein [Hydrogenibacillus schlegelii]PTQ54220.1 MAG: thiamine biosynthesis protein ThiS [Hydrogenibacillus schlegelii]QZA32799.1 hypothetical protein K2M58_11175 [Hydrogenibacillus sp. N12]
MVVRVIMRIPEKKEFTFSGPKKVREILRELKMNPEATLVIKGNTLLTLDDVVEDGEEIEVRSAISGG